MGKKLLIDAKQPEETRVVLLNGNRIEDFDQETTTKLQKYIWLQMFKGKHNVFFLTNCFSMLKNQKDKKKLKSMILHPHLHSQKLSTNETSWQPVPSQEVVPHTKA